MDFKCEIAKALADVIDIDKHEILKFIETPPDSSMGDYAFPCFRLAKTMKKAPSAIADDIAKKINAPEFISRVETAGPYLNFFTDKAFFAKEVISEVLAKGESYGRSSIGNGKTIVIDYSSPNIAKPFHVGHLRSTAIGNAIYKTHEFLGYKCVGVNHLGDWGTQFGKLIYAYKHWGSSEAIEEKGIQELMRIYVKYHEEAEKDPSMDNEARQWFVKMQNGDSEAISLWKWFYDISIKEFERVYDMLGVKFDAYTGESFYNDKMEPVVQELKDKNLLEESEGAMIVPLDEFDMPPCLIIRSDGGTLYATRDITAAIYRKNTYNFHKCLYLTALDQNLHFAQWFKVIKKMGYDWHNDLIHVPFGLVSLESGTLSTRKGNVVLMEDLLKKAVDETLKIIDEKNPQLPEKENVAKQVGIGAVIFNDLYNGRIKDVVFSWEKMLSFEGETGPYVQYTNARARSVLRKAGVETVSANKVDYSSIDESGIEVCRLLDKFPAKIADSASKLEPSVISRYLVDLAQAFNKFYHDNIILTENEAEKNMRLTLVAAVSNVLKTGLGLLGIGAPEQM